MAALMMIRPMMNRLKARPSSHAPRRARVCGGSSVGSIGSAIDRGFVQLFLCCLIEVSDKQSIDPLEISRRVRQVAALGQHCLIEQNRCQGLETFSFGFLQQRL